MRIFLILIMLIPLQAFAGFLEVTQKDMMPHFRDNDDYKKGFCDSWAYNANSEIRRENLPKNADDVFYIYPNFSWTDPRPASIDCKKYQ